MIFGSIFKQFFKYVVIFILCLVPLVVIGAGVYSGLRVYEHKQQYSETFGDITYHDVYEDFNVFDCDLSDAIFYQKNSGYEYNLTIDKSVKFNGSANKYNVLLNNQPSDTEASTAGILTAQNVINLYNINGVQTDKITLEITIKFYQTSVEISISNNNTASQQSQFLTYQKFNGLHLRVIEAQYTKPASEKQYYTISFVDYDNSVISIERVYKGAEIVKPANPERVGYQFTGWSPAVPAVADKDYTFVATYEASRNLLNQPLVYDLQAVNSGNGVTFIINETISEFNKFPYRLQVQVCYFESKANNDYDVIESCTLETLDNLVINGTYTYKNAVAGKEFVINSNYVSFYFSCDVEKTVDGNGLIVFGDIQGAYVELKALTPKTPNEQYLFDHIKIMITSIETISV